MIRLDLGTTRVLLMGDAPGGTVTLPDQSIVTELQSRGQVFRTDVNDAGCGQNPNKIGPDADGEPGGCTNIRIILKDPVPPQVSVWNGS